jgi:hypothetical protein
VRGAERGGHLDSEVDDIRGGEGRFAQSLLEGPPGQQLHRHERLAVVLVDFKYRADVRMIERCRGLCFPLELL